MVHQSDPNTPTIVGALESVGASVQHLGGKGVPDLLVGYLGANYLLEVKAPNKELNGNQDKWHSKWKGQVNVVRTVADAFRVIGLDWEASQ